MSGTGRILQAKKESKQGKEVGMYKESALDHAKRMEQYNVEMYEYQQKMDAESAAAEKEETKKLFNLIERLVLTIREFCPTLELDS